MITRGDGGCASELYPGSTVVVLQLVVQEVGVARGVAAIGATCGAGSARAIGQLQTGHFIASNATDGEYGVGRGFVDHNAANTQPSVLDGNGEQSDSSITVAISNFVAEDFRQLVAKIQIRNGIEGFVKVVRVTPVWVDRQLAIGAGHFGASAYNRRRGCACACANFGNGGRCGVCAWQVSHIASAAAGIDIAVQQSSRCIDRAVFHSAGIVVGRWHSVGNVDDQIAADFFVGAGIDGLDSYGVFDLYATSVIFASAFGVIGVRNGADLVDCIVAIAGDRQFAFRGANNDRCGRCRAKLRKRDIGASHVDLSKPFGIGDLEDLAGNRGIF